MAEELTARQQELLHYLEREIAREGRAPSLREAAADLGVSHAAVAQTLKALERKGVVRREGRYSRNVHLLNRSQETAGVQRWREIPVIGRVTAGLPMYAQQEWDGTLVLDAEGFPGRDLFALRVRGDSMRGVGILEGDLAVCEPRQYAVDGEIVVVLVGGEEATVKRFFRRPDHVELRPENPAYPVMRYGFGEVLVQGKVVGIVRTARD
jgi:repressor LexA